LPPPDGVTPPGEAAADEDDHGTDAHSVRAVFVSGPASGTVTRYSIGCALRGFDRGAGAVASRARITWARLTCSAGMHVARAQLYERRNPISLCHLWRKPVAKATLAALTYGGEQIPMQMVIYTYCG
jgi:hypothetical protein